MLNITDMRMLSTKEIFVTRKTEYFSLDQLHNIQGVANLPNPLVQGVSWTKFYAWLIF